MPIPVHGLGQHVPQVTGALENRRGLGEGTLTFQQFSNWNPTLTNPPTVW